MDCFHSRSKTLGYLETHCPGSGVALVTILVADLADSFNIGKNMSGPQVEDAAKLIVHGYSELKIDDIAFCFTKGKKGLYGELYDRLDSAVIIKWIEKFIADKLEQLDYYWQHQQIEIKSSNTRLLLSEPATVPNDEALKHIREIKKTVSKIQWRNYQARNITISKPVEENLMREIHNQFMEEFNLQHKMESWAEEKPSRGTKFITCGGKRLDIAEYIERKHNQLMAYRDKINYRWGIYPEPSYEEIRQQMTSASPKILQAIKQSKKFGT